MGGAPTSINPDLSSSASSKTNVGVGLTTGGFSFGNYSTGVSTSTLAILIGGIVLVMFIIFRGK